MGKTTTMKDVPDILVIQTDQHTAGALSCAGNPYLSTPHLDALACSGIRFARAYTCQPLCLPARTAMQTGRYPHETGVHTNGRSCRDSWPMLGALMRDAGYRCGYFGKWHVGVGWEQVAVHGYECGHVHHFTDVGLPDIAGRFVEGRDERPMFCTVSFENPHDVCQLARCQPLPRGENPPCPDDPGAWPPLPTNFHTELNQALQWVQTANRSFHYPTASWSDEGWRRYLWGYYRLVERVDAQIGQVLDMWRGMARDNSAIIFLADHGEGVAAHHWNQKQALFEETVGVPCIVSWPCGGVPVGQVDHEHLVDASLDLMPTVLATAGRRSPVENRGRDLIALACGRQTAWRDYLVCETTFARGTNECGVYGRSLISQRWKYTCYSRGAGRECLYDLRQDPGECHNVAAENIATLQTARTSLHAWMIETGDATGLAFLPGAEKRVPAEP